MYHGRHFFYHSRQAYILIGLVRQKTMSKTFTWGNGCYCIIVNYRKLVEEGGFVPVFFFYRKNIQNEI